MDRNFQRSLSLVLRHEGGWSDHPADPGGATMKGVTLANFRRYVKPDATKDDLRRITDAQIATTYRRFYWDAVAGAELPDGLDYAVFDFAVNSGPDRAAKYLQAIVGTPQDGKIGPATLAAVRARPTTDIIKKLCDNRLSFLKRLKTWPTFGKGWTSRVVSVLRDALQMAAQPTPERPSVIQKMVEIPVDKPVVPEKVERKVKEKTGRLAWLTGALGSGSIGLGFLSGLNWDAIIAAGVVLVVFLLILLLARSQIIAAVREIKNAVES